MFHTLRSVLLSWRQSEDDHTKTADSQTTILGTADNDFIHVLGDGHAPKAGYDEIAQATDGKDIIDPGSGTDIVYAGAGADRIVLGANLTAKDSINGESGNDTVTLDGEYNIILKPSTLVSVETLSLAPGHDYTITIDDATIASGGAFTLNGSALASSDALIFSGQADTDARSLHLIGGAGSDHLISVSGDLVQMEGGAGDDNLWTSKTTAHGEYELSGGDGNDRVIGGDGVSHLYGGNGDDWIQPDFLQGSALGLSFVDGGAGDDALDLYGTIKKLQGGKGVDTVSMSDVVFAMPVLSAASTGIEKMDAYGGPSFGDNRDNVIDLSGFVMLSNPSFDARGGNDTLIGNNTSDDDLEGGTGNDTIRGLAGDDRLVGGAGTNILRGDDGNDLLTVGLLNTGDSFPKEVDRMYGGAGDDTIVIEGIHSRFLVQAGDGEDTIEASNVTIHPGDMSGGAGSDAISLSGVTLDFNKFDASSFAAIEELHTTGYMCFGTADDNDFDFSDFTVTGFEGIDLDMGDGDDVAIGTTLNDILMGSSGSDTLKGGDGSDLLVGGSGQDVLDGGSGADAISVDVASDLAGTKFDTVLGFDFSEDRISLGFNGVHLYAAVTKIDAKVTHGALSLSTFFHDMASAIGSHQLKENHAVLFAPDSGKLAHNTFLVVDLNGHLGYQAGEDAVFRLIDFKHPEDLSGTTFG